ncbi:glutathione S-transferase family protein [Phormidium tenue]|uniref:glutathione transferase n=1 Tax=Phormidium tenue NIES-30 TaxID=549789 RepID=A0A1U7IZ94_9CYAN|nr:glutathione S-transferase family protein [Phormidium tenue]MBD2234580.1 glutathione S-transferase family protein [Phormidium tenue FACHB-1052]OKH44288.1 glutathione S-transferase [Phormidium tenue NIES-30]
MNNLPLELVSHYFCPFVQRAVILLLEKEIPYQLTHIDLANKPDWFLEISPLGKVPVLKLGSEVLFESSVICEYLDEVTPGSLHPQDSLEKAKHRAWIEFASSTLVVMYDFLNAHTEKVFEQKHQELMGKLTWIERSLNTPYFGGKSFSLVDAAFAPMFYYFDALDEIADFGLAKAPKVNDWRQILQSHPSVQRAFSEDYSQKLLLLLDQRDSHLSRLAQQSKVLSK